MRRFLFLTLCCVWGACIAQSDFINKWEQQALSKGSTWSYETQRATAAYNYTYTSLYINERFVASFNDAGTCRSKITELKKLAEQIYNQNTPPPPPPKQNSGGINLNKPATQELLRAAGVSEQEMKRKLQSTDNGLNNAYNATQNQKKQDQLSKIDGLCSCRTEQNPNYDPNATMYGSNNDLFDFPHNEGNDENILFDVNTQYDNILNALDASNPRNLTTQTNQPVTLNFDEIMNNGKPYLNPVQKERELDKSKRAYEVAVDKINNYPEEKEKLEKEIQNLMIKNQKCKESIARLQKDSAKFEYQQFIVWYQASDFKYEGYIKYADNMLREKETVLKTQFDFSDEELLQLKEEAKSDLKKGVPTKQLYPKLEKSDLELKEEIGDNFTPKKVISGTEKGIEAGEAIASGIIESVYSTRKNEVSQTIEQHRRLEQRQQERISFIQQQIIDITKERSELQKVFDKYGYDIINDKDEYRIIIFGNECRNALNVSIE